MGSKKSTSRVMLIEKAKRQRYDRPEYRWTDVEIAEHRARFATGIKMSRLNRRYEIGFVLNDIWLALSTAKPESKPGDGVMRMKEVLEKSWKAGRIVEPIQRNRRNKAIMQELEPIIIRFNEKTAEMTRLYFEKKGESR